MPTTAQGRTGADERTSEPARPGPTALRDPVRLAGADRVLAVLKELGHHPDGITLDELTRRLDSPKSTVHRALGALRRSGFAERNRYGHYLLGAEFLRIAFAHQEARPEQVRLAPALADLAARFGETVHYAVLDGREVVYRAKVDPPAGAVRLTSTVGGRNPAHTTAVGKALLAYALDTPAAVAAWIGDADLARPTANSLGDADAMDAALTSVRRRGFATDDQENEPGVNCVAVPVFTQSTTRPSGSVSISALAYRLPLAVLSDRVDEIRAVLADHGWRTAPPGARPVPTTEGE